MLNLQELGTQMRVFIARFFPSNEYHQIRTLAHWERIAEALWEWTSVPSSHRDFNLRGIWELTAWLKRAYILPRVQREILLKHGVGQASYMLDRFVLNEHLTEETQLTLASHRSTTVRSKLAKNPSVTIETQSRLSIKGERSVLEALSKNDNLTSLVAIARIKAADIRLSYATRRLLENECERIRVEESLMGVPDEWIERAYFA